MHTATHQLKMLDSPEYSLQQVRMMEKWMSLHKDKKHRFEIECEGGLKLWLCENLLIY